MPTKATGARTGLPRYPSAEARSLEEGYRSGLEEKIAAQIEKAGHEVHFETLKIPFIQPTKPRTYTPDFPLHNGIVVETKGRFISADRVKHKLIKEQYPLLEIRFVFSSSKTKLSKGSPTSYGKWCEQHGFLYADKSIPPEWLEEPPNPDWIDALAAIAIPTKKAS